MCKFLSFEERRGECSRVMKNYCSWKSWKVMDFQERLSPYQKSFYQLLPEDFQQEDFCPVDGW